MSSYNIRRLVHLATLIVNSFRNFTAQIIGCRNKLDSELFIKLNIFKILKTDILIKLNLYSIVTSLSRKM